MQTFGQFFDNKGKKNPFSYHLEYYDVYNWNIDTKNLPQLAESQSCERFKYLEYPTV